MRKEHPYITKELLKDTHWQHLRAALTFVPTWEIRCVCEYFSLYLRFLSHLNNVLYVRCLSLTCACTITQTSTNSTVSLKITFRSPTGHDCLAIPDTHHLNKFHSFAYYCRNQFIVINIVRACSRRCLKKA